jgi:hypothetical protein
LIAIPLNGLRFTCAAKRRQVGCVLGSRLLQSENFFCNFINFILAIFVN